MSRKHPHAIENTSYASLEQVESEPLPVRFRVGLSVVGACVAYVVYKLGELALAGVLSLWS